MFQCSLASRLSKRDLSVLSKTSNKIRAAVEPVLYREITLEWHKNIRKHAPVHLLVRTLLNRPDMALCVHRLELRGSKPRNDWEACPWSRSYSLPAGPSISIWTAEEKSCFTAEEIYNMKRLFLTFHDKPKDAWDQAFNGGEVDLFIAILLFQLSSLQCLIVESDFQRDTGFAGDVLRHEMGANPTHGFPALRTVTYSPDIVSDIQVRYLKVDLDQVLPLLSAPNIASLSMSLPQLEIGWPHDQIPLSSLTFLALRHTQLSEENMGGLLRAMPRLKSLEYHSHYDVDSGGRPGRSHQEYFDCEKLDNSLIHVTSTLESLVISIRFSSLQSGVALGGFRGMKSRSISLRHVVKLEALEIPILLLFGWESDSQIIMSDLLPSGLQKLCLTDDLYELDESDWTDEKLLELIETYLEQCSRSHSTMSTLDLKLTRTSASWCAGPRTKLKTLCHSAGISCTIQKDKPDVPQFGSSYTSGAQSNRAPSLSRGSGRGRGSRTPRSNT